MWSQSRLQLPATKEVVVGLRLHKPFIPNHVLNMILVLQLINILWYTLLYYRTNLKHVWRFTKKSFNNAKINKFKTTNRKFNPRISKIVPYPYRKGKRSSLSLSLGPLWQEVDPHAQVRNYWGFIEGFLTSTLIHPYHNIMWNISQIGVMWRFPEDKNCEMVKHQKRKFAHEFLLQWFLSLW